MLFQGEGLDGTYGLVGLVLPEECERCYLNPGE